MVQQNIRELMEGERTRLAARKDELRAELDQVEDELQRVEAYLNPPQSSYQRTGRLTPRPQANRAPRGSVQTTVLETIKANPDGLTRKEIIDKLPDTGEQSISNALSTLTKNHFITSQGRGGKYHAAAPEVPTAPDQPSS
jgi:hypothetical protein